MLVSLHGQLLACEDAHRLLRCEPVAVHMRERRMIGGHDYVQPVAFGVASNLAPPAAWERSQLAACF